MSNTIYNKVTVNGTTYIDLSQDTVSDASHIKYGYTGHLNDGTQVTGTLASGGVVISDTLDENGGTIRTITTVETPVSLQTKSNITPGASSVTVTPDTGYDGMTSVQVNGDANLVAANIKSGVTIFGVTGTHEGSSGSSSESGSGITQDQDGYIILPSTGSGSGSGDSSGSGNVEVITTTTGTFTGNGTNVVTISCAFEPREIYISGDLTSDASLRGVVNFRLIKDNFICATNDSSTSNTNENAWFIENITGFNEANSSTQPYASYSNGTLTINTVQNSSGAKFPSGITYNYKLVGLTSPTQHTIHLEFSDSTNTDIPVYYTDSLISSMITAYTPTIYNSKTVTLAQLDNTTWYQPPAIAIGVQLIDYTKTTQDYAINSNGEVYAEQWYSVSDYTPIDPSMTFSYRGCYWFNMAFYTSSKTLISALSISSDSTQDTNDNNVGYGTLSGNKIPSNAAYIRITGGYTPDSDNMSLIRTS